MRTKLTAILLAGLMATGLSNCKNQESEELELLDLLAVYLVLPGSWQKVTPTSGSITLSTTGNTSSKSFTYTPSCSNKPGTNPTFSFFVKQGTDTSKLLINFMGGGACWDAKNCLTDTSTYNTQMGALNLVDRAFASSALNKGILDHNNTSNPFQNWTMVFIPYCTGDVHTGSNDKDYTDPVTGVSHTIKHRGFDNFLSVMNHLKTNFPDSAIDQVMVTGQSAGGYGALFNYPYIKEAYFADRVDLIADASQGVATTTFNSTTQTNWGIDTSLPTWIGGSVTTANFSNLTAALMIEETSEYASYTSGRFAQYTTAYDKTQRWFYNMVLSVESDITYVADFVSLWGPTNASQVSSSVTDTWYSTMTTDIATTEGTTAGNYRYFVAPGNGHTISMSNGFYTETSNGSTVLDFYTKMMTGTSAEWVSVMCSSCNRPDGE